MPTQSYNEAERGLRRLAAGQGGYFTAKQAAQLGYTAPKRNYHVQAGNWEREWRGIFRLALYPQPARPDLMVWWLWSRNREDAPQGVFSHGTALTLHELTDTMPARVHMTVPANFRRSAPTPKGLILHRGTCEPREVETIDGVPVTRALRTLLDVAAMGAAPREDLRAALAEAQRSGKVTRREIAAAEGDPQRRDWLRKITGGRR